MSLSVSPTAHLICRRWLWALLFFAAAEALVVGCIYVWWAHEAQSRLDHLLAGYRAAHQPLIPDDFSLPAVPDERNQAVVLRAAEAALVNSAPLRQHFAEYIDRPELGDVQRRQLEDLIEQNHAALELVTQAWERTDADFGVNYLAAFPSSVRGFGGMLELASLASAAAVANHAAGDDREAWCRIVDALRISRALRTDHGPLIQHLEAQLAARVAADATERLLGPTDRPLADGARRRDQLWLAQELAADDWIRTGHRGAMYAERMNFLAIMQPLLAQGPKAPSLGAPQFIKTLAAIRPLLGLDVAFGLRSMTAYSEAMNPEYARDPAVFGLRFPWRDTFGAFYAHLFTLVTLPSFSSMATREFEEMTKLRLAAVAIAIRMFEIDHGRRPASLTELVPDYLPKLPRDPWSRDDATFYYEPDEPAARIYSVGENGLSDCGMVQKRAGDPNPADDIAFYLNGGRSNAPRP